MLLKLVLPLVLLVSSAVSSRSSTSNANFNVEQIVSQQRNLMRLMLQTYSANGASNRAAGNVDIDACFHYYMTEQDEIMSSYNSAHRSCIDMAAEAKKLLSQQNDEKRESVLSRTHAVCTDLHDCENIDDGLEFFQCSYQASNENYPILYGVSVDSQERVTELKIKYQQIDYEMDICTTKAYNVYIIALENSSKNLQKCLSGESVPVYSPSSPKPTTAITTEETTVEPEPTAEPESIEEPLPEEDLSFRLAAMQRKLMKPV